MFPPSVRTRTRVALLRAVDRAVEFATLGEYGIEDPALEPAVRSPSRGGRSAASRRPAPPPSPGRLPSRVQAATPAGRHAAGGAPRASSPRASEPAPRGV